MWSWAKKSNFSSKNPIKLQIFNFRTKNLKSNLMSNLFSHTAQSNFYRVYYQSTGGVYVAKIWNENVYSPLRANLDFLSFFEFLLFNFDFLFANFINYYIFSLKFNPIQPWITRARLQLLWSNFNLNVIIFFCWLLDSI